jgi:uncharacterized protein with ParB-like and HNH nuclease domain
MPADLKNLSALFNERVFRIPDYQRGYSWTDRQLEDFWDDLRRIPENKNHYVGQITLEPVPENAWQRWDEDVWLISDASLKPFYVVDGQQRLTTAIILVKCLLDLVTDDDELARTPKNQLAAKYLVRRSGPSRGYLFGYERDNPSYEYLKTQILGQPSNQYQGVETVYTANLRRALDFFRSKLSGAQRAQIEDIFKRLTQRFVLNEYEIKDDLDVFVAFETMNNRGKPLSRLELLKNRLIYLSTLIQANDQQRLTLRRNINDAWKTIYEFLGKERGHPLDDDEFLRAHWIMYFKYAREESEQYSSFLLDSHFTAARATDGNLTAEELQKYVSSIQEASRAWYAVQFPASAQQLDNRVRDKLDCLGRVGRGAFDPIAMTALVKHLPPVDVVQLLSEAERFTFLVSKLCRRKSDTGDSEFYRLAGGVFRDESTLTEAIGAIRQRTERHFSWDTAQYEMAQLFEDQSRGGFYGWVGISHFLFEYELDLKARSGAATTKINWEDFIEAKKDHVTIEHIYPQTPRSGQWPTFEGRSETHRRFLTDSLGNLLALARKKNSSLQNHPFKDKVRSADGTVGYFNGSYSEIEVSREPDWTPQEIVDRGIRLLDFMERRWNISPLNRGEKLRFLHLDFMEAGKATATTQQHISLPEETDAIVKLKKLGLSSDQAANVIAELKGKIQSD